MNNIIVYIPLIILLVIVVIYAISEFFNHNKDSSKERYDNKNIYSDAGPTSDDTTKNVLLADSNGNLSIQALGNMASLDISGKNITASGDITAAGKVTANGGIDTSGKVTATGDINTSGSLNIGNWKISSTDTGLVFTNNINNTTKFTINNDGSLVSNKTNNKSFDDYFLVQKNDYVTTVHNWYAGTTKDLSFNGGYLRDDLDGHDGALSFRTYGT